MAYGIHDLDLTGLSVKTILSVHISHEPGEHGLMELTADMGEKNMDTPIQETGNGKKVVLYGKRDGKKTIIFSGVITKLTSKSMGKSCHVKLTARSWSYQMDIKKKARSFQDTSMTYGALVSQIVGEYPGAECQILFADVPLGEIAVQYQETDWQFLKRMLSALHVPLVCSEVRENLCIYAGTAQIPACMDVISVESAWKDMDVLAYWKEIGEEITDTDVIGYRIKLDNRIPLYSDTTFRSRQLTAEKIEYLTIGSTVYEFVTLRRKSGILQKPIYPMQLVGTAFEGTVKEVQGENMKIHLQIDDAYPGDDCYWFPFSTPSASSDGSGWYCMPEVGDRVRVYFPSKRTGDVIAISAVNDRLAEEEAPKDWAREDGGAVPVKKSAKKGSSVGTPIMRSGAVLGKAFTGNIQRAEPAVMRTMEISRKIEPAVMRTMEISGKIEPAVMRTVEISGKIEPAVMRTMEISKKMEPAVMRTMAMPKVSMDKAVTTAVAFGNAGEIRKAAAVFGKEAYKR